MAGFRSNNLNCFWPHFFLILPCPLDRGIQQHHHAGEPVFFLPTCESGCPESNFLHNFLWGSFPLAEPTDSLSVNELDTKFIVR